MAKGRKTQFMSIFGQIEAAVVDSMEAEGKCTKISIADTVRATAPIEADGKDILFSVAMPGQHMKEFERRVAALRA